MNCFPCFTSQKSKKSNSKREHAVAPPPPQENVITRTPGKFFFLFVSVAFLLNKNIFYIYYGNSPINLLFVIVPFF